MGAESECIIESSQNWLKESALRCLSSMLTVEISEITF
jgi:hypothetical protein